MKNLTLEQVKERLQFLRGKYPEYSIWVNIDTKFNPYPISGKCEFFINDNFKAYRPDKEDCDYSHYGYVLPRKYQKVITVKVDEEYRDLERIPLRKLFNKALIVIDSEIMGIAGLYIDHTKRRVVILNSNYKNTEINWNDAGIELI